MTVTIYYVSYIDERTGTGDTVEVHATDPSEAMLIVERSIAGVADYTSAIVSTDPYGIDVIAEYGDRHEHD